MELRKTWRFSISKRLLLFLLLAALLLPFSNGRWTIPAAAWLAPFIVLMSLRFMSQVIGLIVIYLFFMFAFPFQWGSVMPLEGIGFWMFGAVMQLVFLIPYVADRYVSSHRKGILGTLAFPCAFVSIEYVITMFSPYASWGSVAYTQYGNLPLLQIVSITGLSGLTFLVCWFGSVLNWSLQAKTPANKARTGLIVFGSVMAVVLLLGGARLMLSPPVTETIRVAAMTQDSVNPKAAWELQRETVSPADLRIARRVTQIKFDALLQRTEAEAIRGAKVVVWSELSVLVTPKYESEILGQASNLCKERGIYLAMALGTITPGQRDMENKAIVIDPLGDVVLTYHKGRPVPGDAEVGASEKVETIETSLENSQLQFVMTWIFLVIFENREKQMLEY